MGAATILRFPTQHPGLGDRPRDPASRVPRYWSEVQALDPEASRRLLGLTQDIEKKATSLVDYVDANRDEASLSGVETIAIELSAILEGGRLKRVEDALEESADTGRTPHISLEGFAKLRRAEHLILEADRAISKHVESSSRELSVSMAGVPVHQHHCCGLSGHHAELGLSNIPTPLLILGVIGAGAILTVLILALTKK